MIAARLEKRFQRCSRVEDANFGRQMFRLGAGRCQTKRLLLATRNRLPLPLRVQGRQTHTIAIFMTWASCGGYPCSARYVLFPGRVIANQSQPRWRLPCLVRNAEPRVSIFCALLCAVVKTACRRSQILGIRFRGCLLRA